MVRLNFGSIAKVPMDYGLKQEKAAPSAASRVIGKLRGGCLKCFEFRQERKLAAKQSIIERYNQLMVVNYNVGLDALDLGQ